MPPSKLHITLLALASSGGGGEEGGRGDNESQQEDAVRRAIGAFSACAAQASQWYARSPLIGRALPENQEILLLPTLVFHPSSWVMCRLPCFLGFDGLDSFRDRFGDIRVLYAKVGVLTRA